MTGVMKTLQLPTRHRKPVTGATRKSQAPASDSAAFGWLNRVLVLVGMGVVLTVAAQALVALHAIPVQRIVVTGELENTHTEELQMLVQPALVGGFLNADLGHIQTQVESLPWVFEASVRRRWPSTLEIHVVEQFPIARWGEAGFLNHEGQVFHPNSSRDWGSLPLLSGPEGAAGAMLESYHQMVEILAPLNLVAQQLIMDKRGQFEARFTSGMALVLGNSHLVERLQRFVAVYRAELIRHSPEGMRVDLRYQSGLAVAFGEPSQVAGL